MCVYFFLLTFLREIVIFFFLMRLFIKAVDMTPSRILELQAPKGEVALVDGLIIYCRFVLDKLLFYKELGTFITCDSFARLLLILFNEDEVRRRPVVICSFFLGFKYNSS